MHIDLKAVAQCTSVPPAKRSSGMVATLVEKLKHFWFFREIGDRVGSKILFDYCTHLNSAVALNGCPLDLKDALIIVLLGSAQVSNDIEDQLVIREGQSFQLKGSTRCIALGSLMVVYFDCKMAKRLSELQSNCRKTQERKFSMTKGRDHPASEILSDLRNITLLSNIFQGDLRELAIRSKVRCCRPGEVIYDQNEKPSFLYGLVSGKVQIEQKSDEPQVKSSFTLPKKSKLGRISLSICYSKEIFGLQQCLRGISYRAVATSKTEVKLVCVPSEAFHEYVNNTHNRELYRNLQLLVDKKGQLLFARRQSPFQMPEEIVHRDVGKKIIEITNQPIPTTSCLTSRGGSLPYQCYLPQKLFHESATSPRFLKPAKEKIWDIGMLEVQKTKLQSSRYQSESRPKRGRDTSRKWAKLASRLPSFDMSNPTDKLEQSQNMDERQLTMIGFLKPRREAVLTSTSIHSLYGNFRQGTRTRTLRWLDD